MNKHHYKLGIRQRQEIIQMIKDNKTNNDILQYLKDKYNIDITSGYISQIRSRAFIEELSSYNKHIERKLRSKQKIDSYILHLVERGYYIIDKTIQNIDNKQLTIKQLSLLSMVINNAHKIYIDLNRGMDNKQNISYNIKKELGL